MHVVSRRAQGYANSELSHALVQQRFSAAASGGEAVGTERLWHRQQQRSECCSRRIHAGLLPELRRLQDAERRLCGARRIQLSECGEHGRRRKPPPVNVQVVSAPSMLSIYLFNSQVCSRHGLKAGWLS